MNQLRLILLVLGSWLIPGLNLIGEEPKSPSGKVYRDNVCGPRSVLHVLRHYGIEATLYDLVKECQWPDFEKGASLAAITQALLRRGIYSVALELKDGLRHHLEWSQPVIATLATGESPFHYTTLIKGPDGIWNCVEDFNFLMTDMHSDSKSYNYLLLTSDKPISQDEINYVLDIQRGSVFQNSALPITSLLMAIVALLLVITAKRSGLLPRRATLKEGVE